MRHNSLHQQHNSPRKPIIIPIFPIKPIIKSICVVSFFGALLFSVFGCSSSALNTSKPSHLVSIHANDNAIDEESGFTNKELRECAVIVESNQAECDPDMDLANGDFDAAF